MSDEVLGNIYEVLTLVAIADYTSVLQPKENIFWNEHPLGVSIEPDLTIGKDKDTPRIMVLISHTNAERASEKKFWRNIGEFVDAHLALGSSAALANVVFDSGQKRKLAIASESIFDGFIEADRAPYGSGLLKIGATLAEFVTVNNIPVRHRVELVRKRLKSSPADSAVIKRFGEDLDIVLNNSSKFGTGWFGAFQSVQSARPRPRVPGAKRTSVRRGLGRLLPIQDESELRAIVDAARARKPSKLPAYFRTLELSLTTVRGDIISDADILGLVDLLPTDTIAHLWKRSIGSSKALQQARASIAKSSDFPLLHAFVVDQFAAISTPSGLQTALLDCYGSPDVVLRRKVGLSDPDSYGLWLFDYLMTIIKAHSGKQQGYGYTPLDRESGTNLGTGIGPHLSLFVARHNSLRPDLLQAFSGVIAKRLAAIGPIWVASSGKEIEAFYLRGLFEDKIYKIAPFDPLRVLISSSIPPAKFVSRHPTGLTDIVSAGIATCGVMTAKRTVVMWQSASGGHCNDKAKELMGRVGMLRVSGDAKGLTFHPRTNIARVLLMLDGDWTDRHLTDLARAGYDGIFYPDEADQLVKAIV